MAMFIAANLLGSSVQISTLPLPVLSTLQASGLVFNSICATLILGEPFTRWSLWGTLLVCTGAILIAVFGAIPAPVHNLKELLGLLVRKSFIIWMSLQALLVISIATVTELVSNFSSFSQNARFRLMRGLAYGCISGILSAHSLLVAKSAVELIIKTISDSDNQFVHWQAWMLVLSLVVLALSQLYYLHRGLKLVSTSVLYPLVFCIYNIVAILDGLIYFKQTDLITPPHAILISLGTVILLSGVLALSWRLSDEQHPPAVGQSSLAPGLGLVEDTEGEEESLIDSDTLDDDDNIPPTTYQTFAPQDAETTPLTPTRKKSFRWVEQAEIWGELEDQNGISPPANRRRSSTMPSAGETTALLPSRRSVSGSSAQLEAGESSDTQQKRFRRRRKSTGFPGFTARRTRRKSTATLQDAIGGIWKMRWWKGKGKEPSDDSSGLPTGRGTWPAFRDDPEEGSQAGESSNNVNPRRNANDSAV
jgi:magnesium transporter